MSMERRASLAEQFMSSWQSEIFRQRCTAQIEAVRSVTNPRLQEADPVENFLAQNSSVELEEFVFKKSNTREEYMSLVSDMIIMLREHAGKATVDMSVLQSADPSVLEGAGITKEGMDKVNRDQEAAAASKDAK